MGYKTIKNMANIVYSHLTILETVPFNFLTFPNFDTDMSLILLNIF